MLALPSLNSSMKSRACFNMTLIASKMLLLRTPWGWGPTSRPAVKQSEDTFMHGKQFTSNWIDVSGDVLNTALVPGAIWPNLWHSPTGCLATEREVEYFNRGCSLSSTRQLAGAMAFCNTEPTQNKISAAEFPEKKRKKNTLILSRIGWPSHADLTVSGCLDDFRSTEQKI